MKITIINGPNLNLLGIREPEIYGKDTLDDIASRLRQEAGALGVELEFAQSNSEGGIIDALHRARFEANADAVIINPGSYTHYAYAIRDAISAIEIPVIEVHLSNTHAREEFRKVSVIAPVCKGRIEGFGALGYSMALRAAVELAGS